MLLNEHHLDETEAKACLLIASVRAAINNGCKHLLGKKHINYEDDVLRLLAEGKELTVDESKRDSNYKPEEFLEAIRKNFLTKQVEKTFGRHMWHSWTLVTRKDGRLVCYWCDAEPCHTRSMVNIWGNVQVLRSCEACHKNHHGICRDTL
jgi:hypothetical protein